MPKQLNGKFFAKLILLNLFLVLSLYAAPSVAYISGASEPWRKTSYKTSMTEVFGEGNWTDYRMSEGTLPFEGGYSFIYIEGSDSTATELQNYLDANRALIETYVSNGGTIFLNSAENDLASNDLFVGFGDVHIITNYSRSVDAVDPTHTIWNGPYPVVTTNTGGYFGHSDVRSTQNNITNIITGSAGDPTEGKVVFGTFSYGNGFVMLGGMTAVDYHQPTANDENKNLLKNILSFVGVTKVEEISGGGEANEAPTISTEYTNITVSEDNGTTSFDINTTDTDGDDLTITVESNNTNIVTVSPSWNGAVSQATYDSQVLGFDVSTVANANGIAKVTVVVNDGENNVSKSFDINVTAVDDAPVATAMAATVGPSSQNTFDTFIPTFSDAENNNPIMLKIESLPTVGKFESDLDGDGVWEEILTVPFEVPMNQLSKYRYNAGNNTGQNTEVSWSVMTSEDNTYQSGVWSNTTTGVVTIVDSSSNNAPAVNIFMDGGDVNGAVVTIDEDTKTNPIYINFSDDYTPAAFLLGVVSSSDNTKASLMDGDFNITRVSDNNVSVIISPKANIYGDVNISLGAFDGDKNSTKTFTLRINAVNDKPVGTDFEKTIDEDNNYLFSSLDLASIYNDTNDSSQDVAETDLEIFNIVTLPSHGKLHLGDNVALSGDTNITKANLTSLVYTPDTNVNTNVSFSWKAFDGELWTDIKLATININSIDDRPTLAVISDETVLEDSNEFNVTLSGNDVDNDTITYTATSQDTSKATVSIVDGKVVVTPVANANGTVRVIVQAQANGQSTSQSFDVELTSVNDAPSVDTVFNDITVQEDNGTSNYSLNISDIEGDELKVFVESSDSSILSVSSSWPETLTQSDYRDSLDFNLTTLKDANGLVTVSVRVVDENNDTVTQTFDVNVSKVNDKPVVPSLADKIVYKNFADINISLGATDVDGDTLTYSVVASDSSIIDLNSSNNVLTLKSIEGQSGNTDVNVTISDSQYSVSKVFSLKILSFEDGDNIEEEGAVSVESDVNATKTIVEVPDDNLTLTMKENTDGTVAHEIEIDGKKTMATSEVNGSVVDITPTGMFTTYEDTNNALKAEVNATITGKAIHILDVNGTAIKAESEIVGAQTVIKKDANGSLEIETSVEVDANTTISVKAKADGSAQHTVSKGGKVSKATSNLKGAQTVIKVTGDVETTAGQVDDNNGFYIKAVAVTKADGTSITRFVKVSQSDENNITVLGNTMSVATPFDAGNSSTIEQIGGTLYIKVDTTISDKLIVE